MNDHEPANAYTFDLGFYAVTVRPGQATTRDLGGRTVRIVWDGADPPRPLGWCTDPLCDSDGELTITWLALPDPPWHTAVLWARADATWKVCDAARAAYDASAEESLDAWREEEEALRRVRAASKRRRAADAAELAADRAHRAAVALRRDALNDVREARVDAERTAVAGRAESA